MNRLLINMQNKVKIIDVAINQCKSFLNDESITLRGMMGQYSVTRGGMTDEDILSKITKLQLEKHNLCVRIERMM